MSYSEIFRARRYDHHSAQPIEQLLGREHYSPADLPSLLSQEAVKHLPHLAEKSQQLTRQRFGNNLQLFMPLYLSNLCTNVCTYCGFSAEAKLKRTWLRPQEIEREAESLRGKGIAHLLLVSGEAEHRINLTYFKDAIKRLRPFFANLQLESQPFSLEGYQQLLQAGLDGVVVYQETYDREVYRAVHLQGKKTNFEWRLDVADRIAQASMEKIGLGILLGLGNWRDDALMLADHLAYLQKRYWQQRYSLSFPRLRPCASNFKPGQTVSERDMIQLVVAFRLCFPSVEIVLSTREAASLRNLLLTLGITNISAESSTQPGGYSEDSREALEQFAISDTRSLDEVCELIREMNYQPILADQIPVVGYA